MGKLGAASPHLSSGKLPGPQTRSGISRFLQILKHHRHGPTNGNHLATMETQIKSSPLASSTKMAEDLKHHSPPATPSTSSLAGTNASSPNHGRVASESITALVQSDSDSTASDGERTTTADVDASRSSADAAGCKLDETDRMIDHAFLEHVPLLRTFSVAERNGKRRRRVISINLVGVLRVFVCGWSCEMFKMRALIEFIYTVVC